jgi:hypothetical protein
VRIKQLQRPGKAVHRRRRGGGGGGGSSVIIGDDVVCVITRCSQAEAEEDFLQNTKLVKGFKIQK